MKQMKLKQTNVSAHLVQYRFKIHESSPKQRYTNYWHIHKLNQMKLKPGLEASNWPGNRSRLF